MALKKHAISLLRESKSFEYTLDYLLKVEASCRSLIADHGGNAALEAIMNYLAIFYSPSTTDKSTSSSA